MTTAMCVKQEKKEGAKEGKKVPMADTNVVALSLGVLAQEPTLMTGEAVFCEECKAALSALSTLQTADSPNAGNSIFLFIINIYFYLFICYCAHQTRFRRRRRRGGAEVAVRVLRPRQ
jgi:hypothetical protein